MLVNVLQLCRQIKFYIDSELYNLKNVVTVVCQHGPQVVIKYEHKFSGDLLYI